MSIQKRTINKYSDEFKRNIVTLKENGKTYAQLESEYGVSPSAVAKWCKQYSTVTTDDGSILTALQVKELQRRNAQLEEENIILKKAAALFMLDPKGK